MPNKVKFASGKEMKNEFMLAPLTNMQSLEDGTLGDDEYTWLTKRAQGGFGLTMTCAAFAQTSGKGFNGQLGASADSHLDGLKRLAEGIHQHDSLAYTQIVHGGMRTFKKFTGQEPVCPSANEETGARAMTLDEIKATEAAFVEAALLSRKAGFAAWKFTARMAICCASFYRQTLISATMIMAGRWSIARASLTISLQV